MNPGTTFERIYRELKLQLGQGLWRPGTRIEPALVAAELGASVTPVRDALHRLAGERLVEARDQNGFRVPRLTEAELRDLYAWNGRVLALAVSRMRIDAHQGADPPAAGDAAQADALFLRIARATGSGEHLRSIAQLNDRLAPVRHAEVRALGQVADEHAALRTLLDAGARKDLNNALARYHRRRIVAVPGILAMLPQTESPRGD